MCSPADASDRSQSGSTAWYALHVKPHAERRVSDHLSLKPIPTFLPLIETIRSRRTRRLAVLEPLFPGYLFVHLDCVDTDPRWQAVRWTPGVRRVLGTEGNPGPIPDDVMAAI